MSSQLQQLTRAHSLWLRLINIHHTLPLASPVNGPLSLLSTEDLESQVRHMLKVESNWSKPTPTPVNHRKLWRGDAGAVREMCLVPGGRWLAVILEAGDITLWDLDEESSLETAVAFERIPAPDRCSKRWIRLASFDFSNTPQIFRMSVASNDSIRYCSDHSDVYVH